MRLEVFDLFSGCGGMSRGFLDAGHDVVGACEVDDWAAETYAKNHPSVELLHRDIRDISSMELKRFRGQVSIVVGGPPCQGFSVSGKRQYGIFLQKNRLIHEFIRVVEAIRPPFFLLENVKGFESATIDGRTRALHVLLGRLEDLGYSVVSSILQAANYGVPQYRSRLFVVGSACGSIETPFPLPTHSAEGATGARHVSVLEAISDLPPINAGEGNGDLQRYGGPPTNPYQRAMRTRSIGVLNHQAMRHSQRLIDRFRLISPGGKSYQFGREVPGSARVTVYKTNNQRLIGDLPSLVITANFQSSYIHPVLDRNLTAREAARIQSFPDDFVFLGRRTLMSSSLLRREGRDAENHLSQYNQIGNAVPAILARAIASHLAEVLDVRTQRRRRYRHGQQLSLA